MAYEGSPGAYWALLGRKWSSAEPSTTSRLLPRQFVRHRILLMNPPTSEEAAEVLEQRALEEAR